MFAVGAISVVALVITSILSGEVPDATLPMVFFATLATARGLRLRRQHLERRGIPLLQLERMG